MGSFQARLGALWEGYLTHLGMHDAGDKGIARSCGVDDTGGDGFQLFMACAVAAINAVAAEGDKHLFHTHCSESCGGIGRCFALGHRLSLLEVEFQGMQAFGLTLLKRLDDAGSLGGTHGINK